ncbi:hypothetical protein DL240_09660 [Lujinxingia litoralis]|uniref:DUF4878 domain-containing protein n=2 Tax=Lujinxingia litoralis TaxID=2211119 RepID=A0A328C466_9DELT|nr:hypothetical protein DL240_09660 [Lujinxingia litoralis]
MWALALVMLLAGGLPLVTGCSAAQTREKPGDPVALEMSARNFHKNLRWARYEEASQAVHEAAREAFLGRYEELGEDFRVVDLALRKVEFSDDGFEALIEVEQEWYELPETTVRQERFVERWVSEEGRWWMRERLPRDEHRAREKEKREAPQEDTAAQDGPAPDAAL